MTTQFIEFTLPIIVEGHTVADIDVAVEIKVTSKAVGETWTQPAEGPEWEEVGYKVYSGGFESEFEYVSDKKIATHKWLDAPADITARMRDYLSTQAGRDIVADAIREDA